jgi:hypothetical protein
MVLMAVPLGLEETAPSSTSPSGTIPFDQAVFPAEIAGTQKRKGVSGRGHPWFLDPGIPCGGDEKILEFNGIAPREKGES